MAHLTFALIFSSDAIPTLQSHGFHTRGQECSRSAEVAQVLAYALAEFGERQGPEEDGHAWNHELPAQHEDGGWVTLMWTASAELAEAFQTASRPCSSATTQTRLLTDWRPGSFKPEHHSPTGIPCLNRARRSSSSVAPMPSAAASKSRVSGVCISRAWVSLTIRSSLAGS